MPAETSGQPLATRPENSLELLCTSLVVQIKNEGEAVHFRRHAGVRALLNSSLDREELRR